MTSREREGSGGRAARWGMPLSGRRRVAPGGHAGRVGQADRRAGRAALLPHPDKRTGHDGADGETSEVAPAGWWILPTCALGLAFWISLIGWALG